MQPRTPLSAQGAGTHGQPVSRPHHGGHPTKAAWIMALAADGSWQKGTRRLTIVFTDASGATRITIDVR